MGDKKDLTRRGFIAGSALAGATALVPTSLERFLSTLTTGFISKAQAEASGNEGARNYINILMIGGPLRYTFDHWMRTNSSDPQLEYNPMVSTRFTSSNGRVVGTENSVFEYNGVLVPHMFSQSVTTSIGEKALTNLLNNMLVIRGYGSGFDGHPFNAVAQQSPVGGVSSVMGLAADYSTKTFEAVEWPDRSIFGNYNSSKGKALNKLFGSTPVHSLLEGFGGPGGGRVKGRDLKGRNQEAYDLAQARLRAYAQSDFNGASVLAKNLSNATELMKKGIGNIDGYWSQAVARYQSVIETSMRQQGLVGINDVALISDQGDYWRVFVGDGSVKVVSANSDLRDSIKTMSSPSSLAEGLALAEYVLKEGLVSTLNLQMGDPTGLIIKDASTGVDGTYVVAKDMHETGAIPGLLITTAYYRGLCAGIMELAEQLKKTSINGVDLWSETVIQVISEFDRSARASGSGSDHGFNQMVTSVFSGAIQQGPFVVGNIYRGGHGGGYTGTQGIAAPIEGYNQSGKPSPVMAASTVAALLRVPKNPYENLAAPLVRLNGTQLEILKAAKIVES